MITVYTGNGKGKTTSALGAALAARGNGKKVIMLQFLKGSTYSGELTGLYRLGIPLLQFGVGCRWAAMIRSGFRHCSGCGECFRDNRNPALATEFVQTALRFLSGLTPAEYDLIILDEVSHALNYGFLPMDELRHLLTGPGDWILTGRRMPEELMPWADEWWEFRAKKHPLTRGIQSRRGIEY
ncbi:cob(I)yrinic acid a,c-diamide adenosyltransferase [Acididesulfobacillus acetoxydans]|uniref:Cob(I)alamin adenosyltransferase n=1 Tax=Acididesulfobacillus acetoxydans TaxID=1561005 RepID=A0A8S0WGI3_9FIRM|nr:cob(I)yrinic acid a,c-diamide adenosyltransferase [Acididesulfobacillus acetoxydans]CAA7601912.1 cob(I)yrinic acid a,c-diamide adenosyltransferase [Acididesulfobacillus acetoxydans]CEJ08244.1 Cob(I)alamin adenosyltransferase [Acididesulfobacillus acetoxydans]